MESDQRSITYNMRYTVRSLIYHQIFRHYMNKLTTIEGFLERLISGEIALWPLIGTSLNSTEKTFFDILRNLECLLSLYNWHGIEPTAKLTETMCFEDCPQREGRNPTFCYECSTICRICKNIFDKLHTLLTEDSVSVSAEECL